MYLSVSVYKIGDGLACRCSKTVKNRIALNNIIKIQIKTFKTTTLKYVQVNQSRAPHYTLES